MVMEDTSNHHRKHGHERRAEASAKYREMIKNLKEIQTNGDQEALQKYITNNLETADQLYPIVKKKLKGTSEDSRVICETMRICLESANRINRANSGFEGPRLVRMMMRDLESDLGHELKKDDFSKFIANQVFKGLLNCSPTLEFIYGTLKHESLEPKRKRERNYERTPVGPSVTAKQKDMEVDVDQDSTPREVEHLESRLRDLGSNKPEGMPFLETVVDPESFTQTVENIFHVSFLVKEAKVGIKRNETTKKPMISISQAATQSQNPDDVNSNHQSILSFSMQDYQEWIRKYNISARAIARRPAT